MRINESAEMYLEYILELTLESEKVRSIDIAKKTGYSKPSVSRAMGLLKANGLIEISESGYITLSESGNAVANKIFERHRLISDLLIRMGVEQAVAAEDACKIEHVISDESFSKIKTYLKKLEETK